MIDTRWPTIAFFWTLLLSGIVVLAACSSSSTPTPQANPQSVAPSKQPIALAVTPSVQGTTTNLPARFATSPPTVAASTTTARPVPRAVSTRATPARAVTAPPQSIIRFSDYQTAPGDAQIVGVRPDGTGRRTFTAFPGHPWGPRISPDGSLLLFSSAAPATPSRATDLDLNGSGSPDLWIVNADGSQARRLVEGTAGYNGWSWSPDGQWVTFASNRGGTWDIYKVRVTGADLTN